MYVKIVQMQTGEQKTCLLHIALCNFFWISARYYCTKDNALPPRTILLLIASWHAPHWHPSLDETQPRRAPKQWIVIIIKVRKLITTSRLLRKWLLTKRFDLYRFSNWASAVCSGEILRRIASNNRVYCCDALQHTNQICLTRSHTQWVLVICVS